MGKLYTMSTSTYRYLGQLVSFDNRQEKEIDRRIENAWKSYWSMKGELPLCLKRKLVMCILPILTYGAQTWSLTESQKSRLKVCQRSMERSLLSIRLSDRIPTQHHYPVQDPGIVDVGNKSAKLKSNAPGQVGQHHHTLDPWGWKVTERETKKTLERRLGQLPLGLATNSDGQRKMEGYGGGLCPAVGQHRLIKKK